MSAWHLCCIQKGLMGGRHAGGQAHSEAIAAWLPCRTSGRLCNVIVTAISSLQQAGTAACHQG
jgi:hypothetical protein